MKHDSQTANAKTQPPVNQDARTTTPHRRDFLKMMAGGAVAAMSPMLVGCGGGGGGTTGGGPDMDVAQRTAVLDAIDVKARTLDLSDMIGSQQQMLTFLQGRPEFQRTGRAADGSVWGVFTDGRLYRFIHNRLPDGMVAPQIRRSSRVAADSLPRNTRYYSLSGVGTYLTSAHGEVASLLQANGYVQALGSGSEATLDVLKQVSGAGVLYLSTHGGDGDGGFGLTSTTRVSNVLENDPVMIDDLKNHRLIYCTIFLERGPLGGLFDAEPIRVYGFTHEFITKYMSFGENSLVYMDACTSDDLLLRTRAFAKGASCYVGWTAPVRNGDAIKAALFAFDRMLGANEEGPHEDPPQRAFNYMDVYDDMKKRGLDTSPSEDFATAKLIFNPNGASPEYGILAPTIKRMDVDEINSELILNGTFGHITDTVRMNNTTDLTVKSWSPTKIVCNLPLTGTNASGNVQVIVDGHKSNVRQLTEWDLTLNYRWRDIAFPALQITGPVNLRFRADIGDFREKPGQSPTAAGVRYALATRDSATTQSTNSSAAAGACTIFWSGSLTFPSKETNPTAVAFIATRFLIDTAAKTGKVGLAYGHPTGQMFTQTTECPNGSETHTFAILFGVLNGLATFNDPLGRAEVPPLPVAALNIAFDSDFSIIGGSHNSIDTTVHLDWETTPAKFPPDPDAARSAPLPTR
jgi:hypothetical protein